MKQITSNAKTHSCNGRKEYEFIHARQDSLHAFSHLLHNITCFAFLAPLRLCVGNFFFNSTNRTLSNKLPIVIFLVSTTVMAEDAWKGEGELGFTSTSGNTESQSLNAKLGITKTHDQWTHNATVSALKSSTNNVTSTKSTSFLEKSQYNFSEDSYAFGKLRYETDKFSGYDYRGSFTLGFGSRFINTDAHILDASLGLGYRTSKDTATQIITNEGVATADVGYEYKISPTAIFGEIISIESGNENTHSEAETSLKTKINGNLSSKITYLIKHNSDVPVLIEKTDKILTVSLMYSF